MVKNTKDTEEAETKYQDFLSRTWGTGFSREHAQALMDAYSEAMSDMAFVLQDSNPELAKKCSEISYRARNETNLRRGVVESNTRLIDRPFPKR